MTSTINYTRINHDQRLNELENIVQLGLCKINRSRGKVMIVANDLSIEYATFECVKTSDRPNKIVGSITRDIPASIIQRKYFQRPLSRARSRT